MVENPMHPDPKEQDSRVEFIEAPISKDDPAQCGDGRPGTVTITEDGVRKEIPSKPGPKIFGGDLATAKMRADFASKGVVDDAYIAETNALLTENGFTPGGHGDDHANTAEGKCGCGRCDRSDEITKTKVDQHNNIKDSLVSIYTQNLASFQQAGLELSPELLERIFDDAQKSLSRGDLTGKALTDALVASGGIFETVHGPHQETVAFVNLKPGITLDKHALNDRGQQAFGVDLLAGVDRAEAVGVDRNYAAAWLLVDSVATGMVLAPDAEIRLHA